MTYICDVIWPKLVYIYIHELCLFADKIADDKAFFPQKELIFLWKRILGNIISQLVRVQSLSSMTIMGNTLLLIVVTSISLRVGC